MTLPPPPPRGLRSLFLYLRILGDRVDNEDFVFNVFAMSWGVGDGPPQR